MNRVIDSQELSSVLNRNNNSIKEYFQNAIDFGFESNLFELFDKYLLDLLKHNISINTNVLLARILSICSQFNSLCLKSETNCLQNRKYDKSDENKIISKSIRYFENFEFDSGLKCLTESRNAFGIGNKITTDLYDSCVNALVKNCVKTAFDFVCIEDNNHFDGIAVNQWVVAKSAARIDLQGGWSDTAPICYEMGGRVVNIAIQLNNEKPIGAKARKVEPNADKLICIKEYDLNRQLILDLTINSVEQFYDYSDPDSCGALVKSALICCQIIDTKNHKSLDKQLENSLKSGLEIELWSDMPQGSGLGTSSILSGCVIAVIWTLLGKSFSKISLINAILYVEQLLTTGGGWQDQIGGIVGGVKLGRSEQSLPLKVDYKVIEINDSFRTLFETHLMVIYSGRVRLAKNLLQNVIQNWFIRDQRITDCFHELLTNADLCCEAFKRQDLKAIGSLLSRYWEQKKILAPNSEPKQVSLFLKRVEPYIYGGSMCGAGGGGFMALIVKDVEFKNEIISLCEHHLPESHVYDCLIDRNGFELSINGFRYEIPD